MANRHLKRCSVPLFIKEMQIVKSTTSYQLQYLTPVRVAIIKKKKSTNNKRWKEYREKEPSYNVGGNVSWCSHFGKQDSSFSEGKLKLELFCDLAIPPLDTDPEKTIM